MLVLNLTLKNTIIAYDPTFDIVQLWLFIIFDIHIYIFAKVLYIKKTVTKNILTNQFYLIIV